MVPLEYKGGAATGPAEIIVFGILALAIVLLGLFMMRSLKKVTVPYADGTPAQGDAPVDSESDTDANIVTPADGAHVAAPRSGAHVPAPRSGATERSHGPERTDPPR